MEEDANSELPEVYKPFDPNDNKPRVEYKITETNNPV